jgi:hypothetical protein
MIWGRDQNQKIMNKGDASMQHGAIPRRQGNSYTDNRSNSHAKFDTKEVLENEADRDGFLRFSLLRQPSFTYQKNLE